MVKPNKGGLQAVERVLGGSMSEWFWTNPTFPAYNWGFKPLSNWDEAPSIRPYKALLFWCCRAVGP